jgi:hypothetical protein
LFGFLIQQAVVDCRTCLVNDAAVSTSVLLGKFTRFGEFKRQHAAPLTAHVQRQQNDRACLHALEDTAQRFV